MLLSDPRPNSPFLPNPHDQTSLLFYFKQINPVGTMRVAAHNALKKNFDFMFFLQNEKNLYKDLKCEFNYDV